MWHGIIGFLLLFVLSCLSALLRTEETDPTLAKERGIKRVLRKHGLLGRRDK
jgi:hypothetical protein